MKKIIVSVVCLLSLCLLTCKVFASGKDGVCLACEIDDPDYIDGIVNEQLDETSLVYVDAGEYYFDVDNLFEGDDVTDWFTNLPGDDISASIYSIEEKQIVILLEGTPNITSNELVDLDVPNIYVLDEVGPIDEEGSSDVINACVYYNIVNPSLGCSAINISGKKGDVINEEITVSLGEIETGNISFENTVIEGLSFTFKEYTSGVHKGVVLTVTGTLQKDLSLSISIDKDHNSYGIDLTTDKPCVITTVTEDSVPSVPIIIIPPTIPDVPKDTPKHIPVKTGIE